VQVYKGSTGVHGYWCSTGIYGYKCSSVVQKYYRGPGVVQGECIQEYNRGIGVHVKYRGTRVQE
jgi:hypothetical protein